MSATTDQPTLYDLDRDALAGRLDGQPRYRLDQLWSGLYEQLSPPAELTNLPKGLRAELEERLPTALEVVTESVSDSGETVKWLWSLGDHTLVDVKVGTEMLTVKARPTVASRPGERLSVTVDLDRAHLFDASTGLALSGAGR